MPTRRLLIATGAYDLPVAFPGWTLPGVMTAGAVQSLLKSQKLVAPGPFVLAGLHPLLIVVADQLLKSGAEIAEVIDPDPMLAVGAVTERQRGMLKIGQAVTTRFIDGAKVEGSGVTTSKPLASLLLR